nr:MULTISPECIES: IS3 family transposase [unclassified Treponema]
MTKQVFPKEKVSIVCRILTASRSSYYRKEKTVKEEEIALEKAIISTFKRNDGNSGRIRIKKELASNGIRVSEWKISRILKKYGLIAKGGRKKSKKAVQQKKMQRKEKIMRQNLIKDKFSITIPNKLWSSDISEFRIANRKLYVCAIIDVGTRRIVGWAISLHMRESIVHDAFKMAHGRNPHLAEQPYYHSDGGAQFTSKETTELVEKAGFIKSVSRPGVPQDNQPIESFWKTIKREMLSIRHMRFDEAKQTIVKYIELYYNSARLHSSIGYQCPNDVYYKLAI